MAILQMPTVYSPTARNPPALVAPATKLSVAPNRVLACEVRWTAVQPRTRGIMRGVCWVAAWKQQESGACAQFTRPERCHIPHLGDSFAESPTLKSHGCCHSH